METNDGGTNRAYGINFCELLTVVFITLKLCGVIDWNWLWVVSPLLAKAAIFVAVIAIMVTVKIIAEIVKKIADAFKVND